MIIVEKYIKVGNEDKGDKRYMEGDYVEILTNEDRFLGVIMSIQSNYLTIGKETTEGLKCKLIEYNEIISVRKR